VLTFLIRHDSVSKAYLQKSYPRRADMRKRTLGIVCGKGSIKNHGGGEKKLRCVHREVSLFVNGGSRHESPGFS